MNGCCTAESDFEDVRRVCDRIGIPYFAVNFSRQYYDRVFAYFLDEYSRGRTPNPDVLCNREIKFGPFLDKAKEIGADFIATGHYCGISHVDGVHRLLKAADSGKDQTYFLNNLSQKQLADVLFPLGSLDKKRSEANCPNRRTVNGGKKGFDGHLFYRRTKFPQLFGGIPAGQSGRYRGFERQSRGTPRRSYVLHAWTASRAGARRHEGKSKQVVCSGQGLKKQQTCGKSRRRKRAYERRSRV